jgi:phage terminase large subunit
VRACKVPSRHAILRQKFNACKRSVFMGTFPKVVSICFPSLGIRYNKTDYIATLPNGSEIWFGGLDDGERTERILGLEFSTIYFNEASQLDYSSVQMALTRLAEKNDLKKKVYFDFNPPKKTHWSYPLFIKQLDPIDNVPLINPEEYGSLQINPESNIRNIDEDYIKMLQAMPEADRLRFLEGEFSDESDGQAYYAFRREEHVEEFEKRPGTIFGGMDFNVDPMTSALVQYIDNTFWVLDEVYLRGSSDTYKMCDELKTRRYSGIKVIPDSTGRNRKTSGQTDFQILKDSGFTVESTHNPFVTDRVNNVNRLLTAGRIKIHPRCKKLINDLERVSWRDNKLDQSGANKHLTHISDCLGYVCWKLDPFNKEAVRAWTSER